MKNQLVVAIKRYMRTQNLLARLFQRPFNKPTKKVELVLEVISSIFMKPITLQGDILYLSYTLNNEKQVSYVKSLLPDDITTERIPAKPPLGLNLKNCSPRKFLKLLRLINFLLCKRQHFAKDILRLILMADYYLYIVTLSNAKAVLIANDHSMKQSALIYAAKKLNLPIIYIQHGHVVPEFPPLTYDLSILDGQKALDIYQSIRPVEGDVCFKGLKGNSVKLAPIKPPLKILIAPTLYSSINAVEAMSKQLSKIEGVKKIHIRLHPRNKKLKEYQKRFDQDKIVSVHHGRTPLIEEINKFNLVVAGNSGIHIECLKYGVPSILSHSLENYSIKDIYRFLDDAIIYELSEDREEINIAHINKFYANKDWPTRFSKYDASYLVSHEQLEEEIIKKLKFLVYRD